MIPRFVKLEDWMVITDDDATSAKDLEAKATEAAKLANLKSSCWRCAHCLQHPSYTEEEIIKHVYE